MRVLTGFCVDRSLVEYLIHQIEFHRKNATLRYVFDPEQLTVTIEGLKSNPEFIISGDRWF